jgi:hypothetical protein
MSKTYYYRDKVIGLIYNADKPWPTVPDDCVQVEVHPLGTGDELASLRRLKARVEEGRLVGMVVDDVENLEGNETAVAREAIEAYRAELLREEDDDGR